MIVKNTIWNGPKINGTLTQLKMTWFNIDEVRERTACADFNDDERGPTVFDLCLFIIR